LAAAQDALRVRNELTALELQKQGNLVRLEKLSTEKFQLEEERFRLETRLREFTASVEVEKLNVAATRGSVEQGQQRLRELQPELQAATVEQDKLLQRQAEKRSRLHLLEQLEGAREGFDAGAVAALSQSRAAIGSLADRIRVPDQFITAVENALGHNLQLVLTDQPSAVAEILAELSANQSGRASVVELASASGGGAYRPGMDGETAPASGPVSELPPGQIVPALSVIEAEPAVEPLLKSLLSRTYIAADLQTARAQSLNGHAGCDFVTLNGDLLNRHGIYTGGCLKAGGSGQAPSSILGRKNQIAGLQAELAELQAGVAAAGDRRAALVREQTELQAGLQQAQMELRRQEVAVATREGEFNALNHSNRLLHQRIDTAAFEVENLAAQEAEGAEKRGALTVRLNELEVRERAAQEQVAALAAQVEELRGARDAAHTALTESKVALASDEQLASSFRQQLASLGRRLGELDQLADARRTECATFVSRTEQSQLEMEESQARIGRLQVERERVDAGTAGLVEQKNTREGELLRRDEAWRAQRNRLTEWQTQRGALEVELAQKSMLVQNLREKVQQKYHLDLGDIRSEGVPGAPAGEEPARIEARPPEAPAGRAGVTDWDVVREQVEALQRKLDDLGVVNLVAIEEYEETEQRHQFLATQHDDLVNARLQLLEIINRINAQTRQMFLETFEKIRDNFRAMFVDVFGGGRADLVLSDQNDVLESGIEIIARPPGKQLQAISLLSGGEQTMVAVALLFSIYQVKPSPFCVLDELDAPLDESNVVRFVRILQRFIAQSQFVIITHNKRTIGMADVLYGVTMQEHGVSKIVSVKFHRAGEQPELPLKTGPVTA
jgi:chromosome segregation protein